MHVGPEIERFLILAGFFLLSALVLLTISLMLHRNHLRKRAASLQKAEKDAQTNSSLFMDLFYKAPIPLVEASLDGEILRFNEAVETILGYTIEDVPSVAAWYEVAYPDPDYRKEVFESWEALTADAINGDGKIKEREYKVRIKDGSTRVFLIGAGVIGENIIVSMLDIDERKKVEDELISIRERFATLFNLAPFSCVINDLSGRYLMANEHFCRAVGRPEDEIIGKSWKDLEWVIGDDGANTILSEINEQGVCPMREIWITNGENVRYLLFSGRLIDWGRNKAILSAAVNITEKKKVEDELRKQEESLRVTLNSNGDAVIATDTEGRIVRMNRVAEKLTGWPARQANGKLLREVFNIINADTRQPIDDPVSNVLDSGRIVGLANQTLLISKDKNELQIADSGAPIRNDKGDILGVVLVFRDVTEETAEQEQFQQAQKMNALGQLSVGLANDFNNILGTIMEAAELLNDWSGRENDSLNYIEMILNAAERASDLTRKLQTFSSHEDAEMRKIDARTPVDIDEMAKNGLDGVIQKPFRKSEFSRVIKDVLAG